MSHIVGEVQASYRSQTSGASHGLSSRGGVPSPADVQLAADFANEAVDLALAGKTGYMVTKLEGRMQAVPLKEVAGGKKYLDPAYLEMQLARLLA